jgi:hypothetical protein
MWGELRHDPRPCPRMSQHKEPMKQKPRNPKFFFLTPRLLRQRPADGQAQGGGQHAIQSPPGSTDSMEAVMSGEMGGADSGQNVEH